jgi:predicted transcriptional regulator
MLREMLRTIRNGTLVSRRDLASHFNMEFRYIQGYVDALTELGYVRVIRKGTNKLHTLTERGGRLLRELERGS